MSKINWVGVLAATVVAFFIGFLWYGLIFEAQWKTLTGVTGEGDPVWMLAGLGQTFVTMAGLGWIISKAGGGWIGGTKVGLIACVCFALMTSAYNFIYQTADIRLLPIDWSHMLVIYVLGGALIGGLRLGKKA